MEKYGKLSVTSSYQELFESRSCMVNSVSGIVSKENNYYDFLFPSSYRIGSALKGKNYFLRNQFCFAHLYKSTQSCCCHFEVGVGVTL